MHFAYYSDKFRILSYTIPIYVIYTNLRGTPPIYRGSFVLTALKVVWGELAETGV